MRLSATIALIVLLLFFAHRRGGEPEKYTSTIFAVAFAFGIALRLIRGPAHFATLDYPQLLIEVVVLVAILTVAIRANRWWPIWVSSLQILVVSTHLAKLVSIKGLAGVYWMMTTAPTYVQYFLLILGIRSYIIRQKEPHFYPDWRIN